MVNVSGKAEYLGGTKFRFVCPEGHSHVKDVGAKSIPAHKRLNEYACKNIFASYWAQRVNFDCPKCGPSNKPGDARRRLLKTIREKKQAKLPRKK